MGWFQATTQHHFINMRLGCKQARETNYNKQGARAHFCGLGTLAYVSSFTSGSLTTWMLQSAELCLPLRRASTTSIHQHREAGSKSSLTSGRKATSNGYCLISARHLSSSALLSLATKVRCCTRFFRLFCRTWWLVTRAYYIYIIFILYLYYIYIIFILYLYYIYIIFGN